VYDNRDILKFLIYVYGVLCIYFILFMCSLSIETKNCALSFTPRINIFQHISGSTLELQVFNLHVWKDVTDFSNLCRKITGFAEC